MFCTTCGHQLSEGMNMCPNCGADVIAPAASVQMPAIRNYLVQAILVTFCCCMPVGIVAIVFAAQVSSKIAVGDYAGAQAASNNARLWCWIGFAAGLIGIVVYAFTVGFANLAHR